ncbi:MAG: PIN domain-containing protein [Eubacteriales bacterium]|nr:PIN domain-containing protein [Eubacteriales bacterium]
MAKKFYLVDTENVGSVWVDLLPTLGKQDHLLLFYTVNSSGISYEDLLRLVGQEQKYEMIQCFTGRNGLDFQLVSYLGYLIKSNGKAEYVIISNDNGYDAVVRFWEARDIAVSRVRGSVLRRSLTQNNEEDGKLPEAEEEVQPVAVSEVQKKTATRKNRKKNTPDVDLSIWLPEETKGETDRMIEVFQQENRGEVHKIYLGFVKRFGQEKGVAFYRALKPHLNEIYDHLVE